MAETKAKIDVIIPAYKAQNTILRTLSSIATQDIIDDIEVTIVNDADDIGYKKFVDMFSPYFTVREIVMEKNGGPGDARQYGLDHTSNPVVSFIDADDTFSGAFALKTLVAHLFSTPTTACVFSNFLEQQEGVYVQHPNDSVWMFGKVYKRSFINKYKIHFLPGSRANEDNGFNMLCKLCSNKHEQIKFIQDITYYWHFKADSITRVNNAEYSYGGSFPGYTENMIYAIKEAEKRVPFNGSIIQQKVSVLCNLYEYYIETEERDKRFIEQNWNSCVKYYKEVYREIKDKISDEVFSQVYNDVMRNCYVGNKLFGIIPRIGIKEFLAKLEEEASKDDK